MLEQRFWKADYKLKLLAIFFAKFCCKFYLLIWIEMDLCEYKQAYVWTSGSWDSLWYYDTKYFSEGEDKTNKQTNKNVYQCASFKCHISKLHHNWLITGRFCADNQSEMML